MLALLLLLATGAAPPEVVRLHVSEAKVGAWFPPGTELRGLGVESFEALVRSAGEAARARAIRTAPRLLRAEHAARWESGVLFGHSALTIAPGEAGPAALPLEPWSPAIDPKAGDAGRLRVRETGPAALWCDAATTATLALDWQLRARVHSNGRGFSLALPATDTSTLVLDLPEGFVPDGPEGLRQGPEPLGERGRARWRFDGPGGSVDLRFPEATTGPPNPLTDGGAWVSGPTRLELGESSARWTTDWTVTLAPRGPRRLELALDPGLDLVDVTGRGVASFEADPAASGTRVAVAFARESRGPLSVTLQAVARVPVEGPWAIPAARPLNGLWTGGTTTVRLDPSQVLIDCREEAGRRVAPRPGEAAEPTPLVFEAEAPRSVAVLTFRRPRAEVSTEVRGQLVLGNSAPRLKAELTWRVLRGRLLALAVDLPPAWVPDLVQLAGIDEATAWHPEILPDGAVRVHVVPPSGELDRNTLALNLTATATIAGGRGPLALPRVRPAGVRVTDERWVAWTESSLTLQPIAARGLAWIDPRLASGAVPKRPESSSGDTLAPALAWRWIADQAEARVERARVPSEPTASVHLRAVAGRDRLRIDGRIALEAGDEPVRSIPIAVLDAGEDADGWRFHDEATGLELARRPLDAAPRRGAEGLPEAGAALALELPDPRPGLVLVRARLDRPWTGRGSVPRIVLPERFHARGLLLIEVEGGIRSTVEARGLQVLDPGLTARTLEEADDLGPETRRRRAHAFGYESPEGSLELRTEPLEPARAEGAIHQAVLRTVVDPTGARRDRLTLRVAAERARTLDLTLPEDAVLTRLRRDGQPVESTRAGRTLSIPLAGPNSTRTFCTLTLDYHSARPSGGDRTGLRPARPESSLPYLGFEWDVVLPRPWAVAGAGAMLVPTEPAAEAPWPARLLGGGWIAPSTTPRGAVGLGALDARAAALPDEDMTLGEWFTRWDSASVPLILDRMALEAAGWGPKSRVVPTRAGATTEGAARESLRPLGLTAVSLGKFILLTSTAEAPDRPGGPFDGPGARADWERAARQAAVWGQDESDRFESVGRWRGEVTPRLVGPGEPAGAEPVPIGWRLWRYSASGWPEAGTALRLVDRRRQAAWSWTIGLAVLALGGLARPLRPSARVAALTLLVLGGALGVALGTAETLPMTAGALCGAAAVVVLWLRDALTRRRPGRAARAASTVAARGRSSIGPALGAALLLGAVGLAGRARGDGAPRDAILALFSHQGLPDPARPPDRVVLRLRDYDRLKSLADSAEPARPARLGAVNASYRVSRSGPREVLLESDFELEGGEPAAVWRFPVDGTRDVAAELDGLPAAVLIEPGGRTAVVTVAGEGRHRLAVRRLAATVATEDGDMLNVPIVPIASARVEVMRGPEPRRIDLPGARGAIEPGEGAVSARLGPAHRLEVHWTRDDGAARVVPSGAVDGLLLWDAMPAGDLVRARLTFRGPAGFPGIRLGLEPGLRLRGHSIPGVVDVRVEGSPDHPEWVASVDPPLPDGASIGLEFWRPAAPRTPGEGDASPRALPRIEPMGVERYAGALAFRRPPDWSGRVQGGGAGVETMTEEAFVKAWGNLPDEPLTLSGAARFARLPAVSARTGPVVARLLVQPSLQLGIGAGRIEWRLDAELSEIAGRSDHVALEVPADLRLGRVDADGLTDWSRKAGRMLLRFDGAPAKQRAVRIQGWIPAETDPLATGARGQERAVPWPRWSDVETRPGTLTVSAPVPFQVDDEAGGLTPLPAPSTATAPDAVGMIRKSYRVNAPERPGRLRWEVEPPRVSVQVRSRLTIHPEAAEWVATVRYDVVGGASDALHLRLPTAWAEAARVEVVGDGHRLTADARGASTDWTIRPTRPVWGQRRLVIRATRPLPPGPREALAFPNLAPLGRGSVETLLALANATGRAVATEGSPGLQPIADPSAFAPEDASGLLGVPTSLYRVTSENWALKVQSPGRRADLRIGLADIQCTVGPDGSVLGAVRYEVEPHSGPFLPLHLPAGAEPLWATVNQAPTHPLRSVSRDWLVPLAEDVPSQVTLIWRSSAEAGTPGGERRIVLPEPVAPAVPTLVTARVPEGGAVVGRDGGDLAAVARARVESVRAEWLGRRIADGLATIDRGSLRDGEQLVSKLIQFEVLLRAAERAAAFAPSARADSIRVSLERARRARRQLAEAVAAAGLDASERAARVHLGLLDDDPEAEELAIPEPTAEVRIRRVGHPHDFLGESHGPARPLVLGWSPARAAAVASPWQIGGLGAAAVLLALAAGALASRIGRRRAA